MSRRWGRGRRRRWPRWAETAGCAVVAAGLFGFGGVEAYDTYALSSRGIVVPARLIAERDATRDRWIEVEYTTRAGEVVRGRTSNYTDRDRQAFPDVVYDPRKPSRMQSATWGFDYWLAGWCVCCGGLVSWLTVHTGRRGFPDWLRSR